MAHWRTNREAKKMLKELSRPDNIYGEEELADYILCSNLSSDSWSGGKKAGKMRGWGYKARYRFKRLVLSLSITPHCVHTSSRCPSPTYFPFLCPLAFHPSLHYPPFSFNPPSSPSHPLPPTVLPPSFYFTVLLVFGIFFVSISLPAFVTISTHLYPSTDHLYPAIYC